MSQNGLDYYGRTPKLQAVIDSLELFSGTYGVSSPSHWTPLNHGRTLPHGSGVQGKQEAAGRMRQQIIDAQGTRQSHERRHLEPVPVPAQAWPDAKGLDAVLKLLSLRPHLRSAEHVDEILPCLQRLSTVRGLPEVAQRALCAFAGAVEVQQGEYLYRRGDKADTVYVVLKGSVHLIVPAHHSINVHEVEMAVMQAGSGFGDSVFTLSQHAPGQRNTDAVVQASACTLLRLHVKDYDMTISALQAEELLNSLQTPAHLRSDSHISLVTRVVCNQVDFFNKFSEEKRSKFARVLTVIKADQKRSVLYSRQTPADAAYICLSCTVDLYSRALRRKATVISRANSGSIARALSSEKLNQFGEKKAPMLESASKSQVFSEPTSDEARLTALLQGNRLSKRASHEIDSPPVSRTASTESVGAYLPSLPESPITQAGAHSSDSLAAEHQPGAGPFWHFACRTQAWIYLCPCFVSGNSKVCSPLLSQYVIL
jgi:CRP-like cAMP-binding protein